LLLNYINFLVPGSPKSQFSNTKDALIASCRYTKLYSCICCQHRWNIVMRYIYVTAIKILILIKITFSTCFSITNFLYSITTYMLHYNPRHVSGSTMLVFRRSDSIITASSIVTLCKRLQSTPVEIRVCSQPAYCTAVYRD
jgi:hypothetical protein